MINCYNLSFEWSHFEDLNIEYVCLQILKDNRLNVAKQNNEHLFKNKVIIATIMVYNLFMFKMN